MTYNIYAGETLSGTILEDANMIVYNGGTAESTTVNYGGSMYIFSGGVANSTTVNSSGRIHIYSGGGNDIFCFGENWGNDTVNQLANGTVTLWFENDNVLEESPQCYTDGINYVTVSGVSEVTLRFGGTAPVAGAFDDAASEKIFEDKNKGLLA